MVSAPLAKYACIVTSRQKIAANVFIVCFVTLGLIDATPVTSATHARLKSAVDLFLDKIGLWQGYWRLFAPEPRKINVTVSARFIGDGVALEWNSPDWRELSVFEKFFLVRHTKFYDALRLDENQGAWAAFAEYRLRQLPPTVREDVVRVELIRNWKETPNPNQEWIPAGTNIQPDQSFVFFRREVQ
jgi:hypothetical protein